MFTVYGYKQASKKANKHTHACVQYSHTSVGLTQARPNYCNSMSVQLPYGFDTHCLHRMVGVETLWELQYA